MKFRNSFPNRILSLLLCALCVFSVASFSSCSVTKKDAALTLNDVEISKDVTTYFLDKASTELGFDKGRKAIKEETIALATAYYKTNSLAHAHNIKLSIAEKVAVSEKVNATWSIYGPYYTKIGVTKETLTKVFTADTFRDRLILTYYGAGGTEAIADSRLYANFKTNYVVFQAITGYFTTSDLEGNTVRIPQNEIETLVLKFQNMKNMVNAGEQDMEGAADYLSESGIQCSVQTVVLHKNDTSYPTGFFNKVQGADPRQATVIASNDFIFLVLRGEVNMKSEYFTDKKIDIIKSIVGDSIDTIIDGAYTVESDVSSSEFNSYYSLVKNSKEK